jgi:DNA-binding NarL/FixJ family response regulator
MSVRLLIADDHEVVRSGLSNLLSGTEVEIVGEASSGEEAVSMAIEKQPDVVLLDIRMTETDGLAALEQIRAALPETRVVMLSTYDNPTYIARAVALGASDYLLKGVSRPQLLASITAKGAEGAAVRSEPLRRVQGAMETRRTDVDDGVSLTQRESQVLRHMALGLSNKEIGRSLEISVETVKEHVQNILRKIQVNDRTQAAVWAVRRKLV